MLPSSSPLFRLIPEKCVRHYFLLIVRGSKTFKRTRIFEHVKYWGRFFQRVPKRYFGPRRCSFRCSLFHCGADAFVCVFNNSLSTQREKKIWPRIDTCCLENAMHTFRHAASILASELRASFALPLSQNEIKSKVGPSVRARHYIYIIRHRPIPRHAGPACKYVLYRCTCTRIQYYSNSGGNRIPSGIGICTFLHFSEGSILATIFVSELRFISSMYNV